MLNFVLDSEDSAQNKIDKNCPQDYILVIETGNKMNMNGMSGIIISKEKKIKQWKEEATE